VNATNDELKVQWPDVVGNLRVDQAWGAAQIMGAIHQVGGGYYAPSLAAGACVPGVGFQTCNGHPSDEIGFAVGAGIKVNFPMIGPGDYLQAQVNYTEGASRYAALTPAGTASPGIFGNGGGLPGTGGLGLGIFADGVFCGTSSIAAATATCPAGGSGVSLTTVWSVQAAYEHFWTPSLRTSLVGAYTDTSYDAAASARMCASAAGGAANTFAFVVPANCGAGSWDWQYWSVSSRTQWNITKDFYVGLEGFYGHLNTLSKGQLVTYTSAGGVASAQPTAVRLLDDQDVFVWRMRVHRDLVP
jgi:hypothetical protein